MESREESKVAEEVKVAEEIDEDVPIKLSKEDRSPAKISAPFSHNIDLPVPSARGTPIQSISARMVDRAGMDKAWESINRKLEGDMVSQRVSPPEEPTNAKLKEVKTAHVKKKRLRGIANQLEIDMVFDAKTPLDYGWGFIKESPKTRSTTSLFDVPVRTRAARDIGASQLSDRGGRRESVEHERKRKEKLDRGAQNGSGTKRECSNSILLESVNKAHKNGGKEVSVPRGASLQNQQMCGGKQVRVFACFWSVFYVFHVFYFCFLCVSVRRR